MQLKNTFFTILLTTFLLQARSQKIITGPKGEMFSVCTVASELSDPWEICIGPDNQLWVTESRGYRVTRIHPANGTRSTLLDLNNAKNFLRYDLMSRKESGGKPWPQSGLMGMAIHPAFSQGHPYVYLAWLSEFKGAREAGDGCLTNHGGCFFKTTIARFRYDSAAQRLTDPAVVCDTIPGSNDHNGGRLTIAPVNNNWYLFYTVGDMGAGQFGNAGRTNHAQDHASYEGKVLRFNTTPDDDSGYYNKWIPNDNPFNSNNAQNAVWSTGHRNAQGICYAEVAGQSRIYVAEHGPFSDDEVNLIEKGMNYGHPFVIGYNDNNYNQLAAGTNPTTNAPGKWHTTYPLITNENANAKAIGPKYRDPMISLYPVNNDSLKSLFATLQDTAEDKPEWPSEAVCAITVYQSDFIPGWRNSLLVTTLKGGKLLRLPLAPNGDKIEGHAISYLGAKMRYRDVAISPDGSTIYLATDSSSITSGPTQHGKVVAEQRGTIIALKYIGQKQEATPPTPEATPPTEQETTPQVQQEADPLLGSAKSALCKSKEQCLQHHRK